MPRRCLFLFLNTMPNNKNIECEIRGCITRGDFNEIKGVIEKDFGEMNEGPELVVFFKGNYDLRLRFNKDGGVLTLKETVDKRTHSKRETEFNFSFDNIRGAINFLSHLGFDKGLFSYCYRFDTSRGNQKISVKFDTKIGDLFEIDEVVTEEADLGKIYAGLRKVASRYGLSPWTQEAYKSIVKNSWSGVEPEALIANNKIHPLIERVVRESEDVRSTNYSTNTIAKILKNRSHRYR